MADTSKMLYALAVFDEKTEEKLCLMRKKLVDSGFAGSQTGGIPFHFTLCARPLGDEGELLSVMKTLERSGQVPVEFSGIGQFGERVLFVTCPVSDALSRLQLGFGADERWLPHATMYLTETGGLENARGVLETAFAPFSGTITGVMLYEFFPSRFIAEVRL